MVKKITGKPGSGKTNKTTSVESTKTVGSSKVGNVSNVKGSEKSTATNAVSADITPEMKDEIFQLIDEVAENMFQGSDGSSQKRRATIKDAVKMAIEAGIIEGKES